MNSKVAILLSGVNGLNGRRGVYVPDFSTVQREYFDALRKCSGSYIDFDNEEVMQDANSTSDFSDNKEIAKILAKCIFGTYHPAKAGNPYDDKIKELSQLPTEVFVYHTDDMKEAFLAELKEHVEERIKYATRTLTDKELEEELETIKQSYSDAIKQLDEKIAELCENAKKALTEKKEQDAKISEDVKRAMETSKKITESVSVESKPKAKK